MLFSNWVLVLSVGKDPDFVFPVGAPQWTDESQGDPLQLGDQRASGPIEAEGRHRLIYVLLVCHPSLAL